MAYNRIVFPDRAENMKNSKMKSYKVFLDYMDDFIKYLKASNEKVYTRGTSFALAVYGEQGIGKTLLAGKIKEDFEETKAKINRGETIKFDSNNIWHRITGSKKSVNNIIDVTNSTDIYQIYEDSDWVKKHKDKCKNERQKVIIIDNAEKAYFGASLIGISEDEFFAKVNEDNNMLIYSLLAQKFVSLARNEFSNTLFIILANRKPILQSFFDEAQKINEGMVVIKEMPRPSNDMKEKIVRTNINRLNPISYWDCIDKSGPESKVDLYKKLNEINSFSQIFNAVDDGFCNPNKRIGRKAKKCILSLVVLCPQINHMDTIASNFANGNKYDTILECNDVATIYEVPEHFCQRTFDSKNSEYKMLESEFTLQLIFLSNYWIRALLKPGNSQNKAIECLNVLLEPVKISSNKTEQIKQKEDKCKEIMSITDFVTNHELENFWKLGAIRANKYESIFRNFYVDEYNKSFCKGFSKRPDLLITDYSPCSVLSAESVNINDINKAIMRKCIAVEFTAQKSATYESVKKYLLEKLPNYINLLKEL